MMTAAGCTDRTSQQVSYAVEDHLTEAKIFAEGVISTNRQNHSLTPYIAPDESYLIFCRAIHETDADLYISYNQNGEWLPAEPLTPAVNLAGHIETTPSMSPDGKYFFFSRLIGTGVNGGTIYQIDAAAAGIR